jgi:acid phosphatase (class A)
MKKQIILLFMYAVTAYTTTAQQNSNLALAPVSDHYKDLQQYSAAVNLQRAWMDTIKYPPAEYGNSITFLLVKPYYLSPDQVSALSMTVNPPANSSDQVRKELDYLLDLQTKRTAEQIKRVEFLGDIGYWPQINLLPTHDSYNQNLKDLFFEGRELLEDNVNAKNFPTISKLLQGVMQDMRIMEFTIKYKLLRPRPYHLEPTLSPLTRINSPSFASGHTLWAFIQAFTWAQIIPEKQNDFIILAEEIRRSREIMGIHFPSDNEASRQVAYKMTQFYWKNPVFQKDLKNAIQEWNSKRNTILAK